MVNTKAARAVLPRATNEPGYTLIASPTNRHAAAGEEMTGDEIVATPQTFVARCHAGRIDDMRLSCHQRHADMWQRRFLLPA